MRGVEDSNEGRNVQGKRNETKIGQSDQAEKNT